MALTELKIKNLKPRDKRYLVNDGQGLYIAVMPTGEKYWYVRTWKEGKEHKRSIGRYPDIGLKEARELKYKPQEPDDEKKVLFASVLEEWYQGLYLPSCAKNTARATRSFIDKYVLPSLGSCPLKDIAPRQVFEIIRPLAETRRAVPYRVRSIISHVFQYAIASGLCEWDPAAQVSGALTPYRSEQHRSTIQTEDQARALMKSIDTWQGNPILRLALFLLAYTFVRPSELRLSQWPEIDMGKREWRIPAERMKMKRGHIVPLSTQALEMFRQLRELSSHPVWCFCSPVTNAAFSESTLLGAAHSLSYEGRFTPHGFRGMASTLLNEHGFPPDVIERQLAHVEGNAVRAAYNRAEYLDQRRQMMQWWGDYLDELITSAKSTSPSP